MAETIFKKARELFFTYGLKSISMDDLARQAGVSKKTIYQAVADKQELIGKVVDELIHCHQEQLQISRQSAPDAVAETLKLACLPFETLAAVNYSFFYELEKFFPQEWKKVQQYRQQVIHPTIVANLNRGRAEGLYREDLDVEFTAAIRLQQLTTALNPEGFSDKRMDPRQVMSDLTRFYLHAIVNEKGKQLLNKYLD